MEIKKLSHSILEEKEKYLILLEKEKDIFFKDDDIQKIDIGEIREKFLKLISIDTINFYNLDAFCRKINQTLELYPQVDRNTLENFWDNYIGSVESRERTLSDFLPVDPQSDEISLIDGGVFNQEKLNLQVELLKMQEWVVEEKKKIVIVFEGRDGAGKGSTIKKFIEYLNPRGIRVVALGRPTPQESINWFERYEKYLPQEGEIVFFDRSWYNRAVVEPVMGYSTQEQYYDFMSKVNYWEKKLQDDGIILIKLWFSITREKQLQRFELRKNSPLKYWKLSPNDLQIVDKWELITFYKNQMFNKTSTNNSPWVIINSNDKKVGILNAMRYTLSYIDYPDKNKKIIEWFPEVVTVLKF